MELADFHNRLRVLTSIDMKELVEAGVIARPEYPNYWGDVRKAYDRFAADPFRWFLRTDDETAEKLWALIEKRAAVRQRIAI